MDQEQTGKAKAVRWLLIILTPTALVLAFLALRQNPALARLPALQEARSGPAAGNVLEASGLVEVDEVSVSSEFGGRIAAIPVREGQRVTAGDVLVELDTAAMDAQIDVARAALEVAQAGLEQARAGVRPGEVAVAQAQLAQTEVAHLAAAQAVSDTLALVENPQDVRLQIAVAQAQVEAAEHQVQQAAAMKDAAEVAKNTFEDARELAGGSGRHRSHVHSGSVEEAVSDLPGVDLSGLEDGVHTFGDFEVHINGDTYDLYKWVNVSIPLDAHLTPNQWWQAWVGVNAATAQQEGVQASLGQLYSQLQNPQTLEATLDEALSAEAQAAAQVSVARAQVRAVQAGATAEELAALEARVNEARAALDALLAQREMMRVTAPADGVVVNVMAHPGEVAAATAPLLTMANLSQVRLVVYLSEAQIARVRLGQDVQVAVDGSPRQTFEGEITHIAGQAEFTPRNVSTAEERTILVYAVEVSLQNEDGALKPGMPAEVVLE